MLSLLTYLRPYWKNVVAVLLLSLGAIMLELYLPTLMADVVDVGIVNGDLPFVIKTGALMIACAVIAIVFAVGISFFASRAALGFSRDVRYKLFAHVEGFSLQEFEKFGAASLITRTTNDIRQVQDVMNMILRMMVRAPLMLIGGIIMAISRDAKLSLIFLAALPVLAGMIVIIAMKAIPLFNQLQKKTDRLNLLIRESLIGVRVVRAFNRVGFEKKRFNEANEDFRDTGIKVNRIIAFTFPVMMIVMNVTSIAIVWFGAIRIDNGVMEVGNLMAFLQYAGMILFSLLMLSMAFIMIPRGQASAKRINEVLAIRPAIMNAEQSKDVSIHQHKELRFNGVTFHYQGAEKAAIKDISFTAKAGQTTAIIGSTGAGKSTLVRMIPRFYDVDEGEILIDGIDIRELPLDKLRGTIGFVPQTASIFSGTIADNVRIGKREATDEEVWHALEVAQADYVNNDEVGIDMVIEQGGVNLSGGQKQRLSIARALVRKPDIYIFDDSFSALDYKTDARLRKALVAETKHATMIIVAQRVSTVIDADQIIVLNEGKIAGIGTHDQLLRDNGIYQEIVASQQTGEESA